MKSFETLYYSLLGVAAVLTVISLILVVVAIR